LAIPPFWLAKHGECAWLAIPSFLHAIHRSLAPVSSFVPSSRSRTSSSKKLCRAMRAVYLSLSRSTNPSSPHSVFTCSTCSPTNTTAARNGTTRRYVPVLAVVPVHGPSRRSGPPAPTRRPWWLQLQVLVRRRCPPLADVPVHGQGVLRADLRRLGVLSP
jgi:hypothetical protein